MQAWGQAFRIPTAARGRAQASMGMSCQPIAGYEREMFSAGCTMNIGSKKLLREVASTFCGAQVYQGVNGASKLGSILGPDSAEHPLQPHYKTQNRAKRFNTLDDRSCFGTKSLVLPLNDFECNLGPFWVLFRDARPASSKLNLF